MPGDTLRINNKAVKENSYDAIVIGTGMSGGWAMKELTEQGLQVLAIERCPEICKRRQKNFTCLNYSCILSRKIALLPAPPPQTCFAYWSAGFCDGTLCHHFL